MSKLISRTVKIQFTIKEIAEALGRKKWVEHSDYCDADSYDDVHHEGYTSRAMRKQDFRSELAEKAKKIFPDCIAVALEECERSAWASAIGDRRRAALVADLENISISDGDYEYSGDEGSETVSFEGSARIATVDMIVENGTMDLTFENPEHLINAIIDGMGYYHAPFDPYKEADLKEIKDRFLACAENYFTVYGESQEDGELSSQFSPDFKDEDFESALKERINGQTPDEVADAVIEAVEHGEFNTYGTAAKAAAELRDDIKLTAIKAMVKKALKESDESRRSREQGRSEDLD